MGGMKLHGVVELERVSLSGDALWVGSLTKTWWLARVQHTHQKPSCQDGATEVPIEWRWHQSVRRYIPQVLTAGVGLVNLIYTLLDWMNK